MNDTMIKVDNFSKRYGEVVAVNSITFKVYKGEIFGLLGPNGAGKTTTLESLEGLRSPDSGSLNVAGVDPTREAKKIRHLIGVQLQTSGLPEGISPKEAMKFFCTYQGIPSRYDLLDRLGLADKYHVPYHALSTGQKRRLSLALSVAHNPPVLFLDEPTAGLDVASRNDLHNLMRELKDNGTTILLATHDMAEAELLADRVAILLQGAIAAVGTPLEITATGSELTKVSVCTEMSSLQRNGVYIPAVKDKKIKGDYVVYYSTDIAPTVSAIIDQIQKQDDTVIDLRVERPSLEDRFLEITHIGVL
jgi:ABC-2 type transport system ATP-binding protein